MGIVGCYTKIGFDLDYYVQMSLTVDVLDLHYM